MKTSLFGGFALALVLLNACDTNRDTTDPIPQPEASIPVTLIELSPGDFGADVLVSGHFTTDDETLLSFKTGGIISSVLVREGDYIRKDQPLAMLDVTEIEAQVKQAELALEKAERDFKRADALYRDSVITQEMMENAQTGMEMAKEQMKAADFNLETTVIKAPGNGYVLRKFAQAGQIIGPGMPVLLVNSAAGAQWILKASVSDKDWARIAINDSATVEIDILPGKELKGYVSHKLEGADPSSGAFTIEISLKDKAPERMATGIFGKARIFPSDRKSVWSVPYEAVLDGHGSSGYVFITKDDKTAVKTAVNIAGISKDFVLIDAGLEAGDQIIRAGSAFLKDGSSIHIVESSSNELP